MITPQNCPKEMRKERDCKANYTDFDDKMCNEEKILQIKEEGNKAEIS